MDCNTPGLPIPHHLLELTQVQVHWITGAIQPSQPLMPSSSFAFNLSQHQGLFQWVDCLHQSKYWSFNFSISPSTEHSALISLRTDWFDLLVVQVTLKSLPQHNYTESILQYSPFFIVQFSRPCMTTGNTIALTIQTFVSKVMSLLFNTLPRFVTAFLPRSLCLLISCLQSPSAVILESEKRETVTPSTFPFYSPWSGGTICHDLGFLVLSFKPDY